MEVWPSIDLMDGKVVRLTRGDPSSMKVYSDEPSSVAKNWMDLGVDGLHIVDLDATLGRGCNRPSILSIVKSVDIPVQVGGGIRDSKYAKELFEEGVYRVVLGTLAFKNPIELKGLLREYGSERVMVALDYRSGIVMVDGWRRSTEFSLIDALNRFKGEGVKLFLLTSIDRDGGLSGPDLSTIESIRGVKGVEIFASGGVRSIEDMIKLRDLGVRGVILGKALYEGTINLKEAILLIKRCGGIV
ncbi:MAG: 1-(5-phosphoribosyl)-5-[(5-phosphoribosylamino)methylideneamino]imidazole-4-carboxamide isomerase [Nitrososphaerales archaeon]|nr:1-(5-phosphoribosyl)-5-[(5-phosphoribosylamino)methylideneamino]imidazole-4-carboxamide isomerase [Nitrososphaerales archaeon]